ncbi:MAG: hypothetical protein IJ391_02350 [Clostridia bacterium]|nr:hypothetical protein [Clostridia bacterium]
MNENKENMTAVTDGTADKPISPRNDIVARILCVIGAILLWFYAVSSQTIIEDRRFVSIPVELIGADTLEEEYGMTVISGYDYSVDLTLSGTRSELSKIGAEDLSAYVDLSQISAAGEYSLDVRTSAPSGISLKELSSNYVNVYVDKRTQKNVEIRVNPVYIIESDYSLGTPDTNVEIVTISGPADVLDSITHAQVTVDVGKLTKSVTTSGSVVLYADSTPVTNPYVKVSESDVTVSIPVYTEKEVPLSIGFKYGYFNEKNTHITIDPASVRIKGDPSELEKITSIELLTLDEKKITGTTSMSTAVVELPDTVENLSRADSAVITVSLLNTATRVINIDNITVKNPNGLEYTMAAEDINITLRGSSGSLSLVTESNIGLEADLSYYSEGTGRVSIPIKVVLPSSLQPNVYELGEYTIEFDIK